MAGHLRAIGLLLLSLRVDCKGAPSPQLTAAANASASSAATAVQIASPLPEDKRTSASFAMFDGPKLVICTDYDMPIESASAIAAMYSKPTPGKITASKLSQTCDSLGQAALTTCTNSAMPLRTAQHYYDLKHSDKYMADCVKGGGRWETNHSAEAEVSRSQQELEALQHQQGQ